jgi:hypothetical protein
VSAEKHAPETLVIWRTTSPHPGVIEGWKRSHAHGANQGQVGWKLHALVLKHDDEDSEPGFRPTALCGCNPRHGWALDLFIDAECSRCVDAMGKREAAGEVFANVDERRHIAYEAAQREKFLREEAADPANHSGDWPFPASIAEATGSDA